MRVSIIKSNKIDSIILSNKVEGNYWISETDRDGIKRNLISIEAENNKWKLVSNNEVFYIDKNNKVPFVYLEQNSFYLIRNDVEHKDFYIFCINFENNFAYYDINAHLNSGFSIGTDDTCFINYSILDIISCTVKLLDEKPIITDNHSKFGIYINNIRLKGSQELKNGDIIFIVGLKLVFVILNNDNKLSYYLGVTRNIGNLSVREKPLSLPPQKNIEYKEEEDEIDYPIYDESEYFNKTPRFVNQIKPLEISVDAPPAKQNDNTSSILLTIGPMITMSMTSVVTGYAAINNVLSGESTWEKSIPSIIICVSMIASVFIWPLISKKYEKKVRHDNERKRQEKYNQYIESKRTIILEEKNKQSIILKNNYPSLDACINTIMTPLTSLWERKIGDEDFLEVNLGIGSCPMQIDIKYPEEHFSMEEDNLKDLVMKLGNEPKNLSQVPIAYSIIKHPITSIVGSLEFCTEYARRLILQLLALHSYDELKIIILTDEEKEYQWKYFKTIPHIFTDDKTLRFFATKNEDYKEVCYYLDKIFELRKEKAGSADPKIEDYKVFYLIVTDSLKKIKSFEVINKIFESKKNYGFATIIIDEKITNLPEQCTSFIKIEEHYGQLIDNEDLNNTRKFIFDNVTTIDYEGIAKKLSNIPIGFHFDDEGKLPNKVGFLEMYDVGKIEQLNALTRWQNSNPMLNLAAEVGIGRSGEKISIDLHEKYHGPHGLIAGMTGSGKSEFIITYILSMALNYHPYEVQFILIDYKGGGLANAFENPILGIKLPHLVGKITNLDVNEIKRSLASIESELKRRQELFNKARELSGESTVDIYKYQRMYRNKIVTEPVSHLFIICDEFAELKNEQPEFMEQLISTARIGRSLGVHLILSTQKPSGVVDPQIWSNTRFRVCMRVQDKSDSNEVIKCSDAAFLKQTGRFYFQVGYNEVFILGQAAWAGGKYIPMDKANKTIDTSIDFINNVGYSINSIDTKVKREVTNNAQGEELTNIISYLANIAKEQNIVCRPLWLDKIPENIRVEDLINKYNYLPEPYSINPIIGEYDVPNKQEQRLLTIPLSKEGNALIYGASGTGKENFITTMIYSSLLYYTPQEINYYIIDFGSEALQMYNNCPIVGNVLGSDDEERIENLYKMISTTIEERKNLFADYNGDYETYCKNSGKTVPSLVIVINNYESYQETYAKYDDTLVYLSRECVKYGIYFVITLNTPNGIRFKLKQNFALNYVLQQNSNEDYVTILGNINRNYPARIFGRGIIKTDDVYEFQTALVTEKSLIPQYIRNICAEYSRKYDYKAKSVPVLPKTIGYKEISSEFAKTTDLIIGLEKDTLEICKFNFTKNYATLISALDINDISSFVNCLINQIIAVNNKSLVVINTEDFEINPKYRPLYQYVDNKFDDIFNSLLNYTKNQKSKYELSNHDKHIFDNKKPIYCVIIGVENFKNHLSNTNKVKFSELFSNAQDLGVINYILVDSLDKIKKIEFDSWYKECVSPSSGIWIGNGINEQYIIKISKRIDAMKENLPNGFCFVINRGKVKYVKYVTELDLKV